MSNIKNLNKTICSKLTVPKLNLAMLLVLVAFISYTLFAPITPAVYGKPVIQNASSLYAGHTLTYKIHTCRKVGDGVVTTITRQLVPVNNTQLQPIVLSTDVVTNPAHCQDNTKTLIIPYPTPQGKYRLVIRGVYAIIPLRKPITVSAQSDPVTIRSTDVSQEIQDLIDANNLLQKQLESQTPAPNTSTSTTTQNKNGTSTTSTNTNSTTTTNNTNNNSGSAGGAGTGSGGGNDSVIQQLIKALGGGINLKL